MAITTIVAALLGMLMTTADEPPRVAAAISLREPLGAIAAEYQKQTGIAVEFNFGASGQLEAQIRQGAPVDLFISAADAQIKALIESKLVDPASRTVIAGNELVLIVPADAKEPTASFAELASERVRRVAIGEPKTVPAGEYARQVLAHLKIESALKDRLIFGTNVRQVLTYVERGEVDAGIVYRTDAIQSGEKVRVVGRAEPAWHQPIVYPAAVVSASTRREAASAFLAYLTSDSARDILASKGFALPEKPAGR